MIVLALLLVPASDDTQKSHRSRHRVHRSSGSYHKTMSRTHSCDSQSKGSISTRGSTVHSPMLSSTSSLVCILRPPKANYFILRLVFSTSRCLMIVSFSCSSHPLSRKLTSANWRWLLYGDIGATSISWDFSILSFLPLFIGCFFFLLWKNA